MLQSNLKWFGVSSKSTSWTWEYGRPQDNSWAKQLRFYSTWSQVNLNASGRIMVVAMGNTVMLKWWVLSHDTKFVRIHHFSDPWSFVLYSKLVRYIMNINIVWKKWRNKLLDYWMTVETNQNIILFVLFIPCINQIWNNTCTTKKRGIY